MSTSGPAPQTFYTPELLAKLGHWSAAAFQGVKPETIAHALHQAGIGIVDLDRHRCLVDERVYESALHRAHAAEERAASVAAQMQAETAFFNGET